jgi:hypothetical protein
MMRAEEKKRLQRLLAVMGVMALLVAFTYRDVLMARPVSDSSFAAIEVAKLSGELEELGKLPALQIERPDGDVAIAGKRRLFEWARSPEDIAAERAREEQQRRAEAEALRRQREQEEYLRQNPPPPQPPPPPPPPQTPPFNFQYIAHVITSGTSEEIMACLMRSGAGKKDKFIWVKVGEIVENKFVIEKIDEESITIGYTDQQFKDRHQKVDIVKGQGAKR